MPDTATWIIITGGAALFLVSLSMVGWFMWQSYKVKNSIPKDIKGLYEAAEKIASGLTSDETQVDHYSIIHQVIQGKKSNDKNEARMLKEDERRKLEDAECNTTIEVPEPSPTKQDGTGPTVELKSS